MAKPTVLPFGAGIVYIGDGEDPEVFTKLCGFNSMSLTIEKDTNDNTVPDCDDPDAAAWQSTDVLSLAWSMEFEGVYAKESSDLIWAAVSTGQASNIRVRLVNAGDGSGTPDLQFAGKGHFGLELTGERGSKWQNTLPVTGDGELVRTKVAALA
ncbi:MAG: hypothetical protein EOO23_05260 [Comamonadaceae bacterium]|nr:MAG: hypothetical protein EOO23_05260 [Comamonadaceae bacterium]